MGSPTSPRGYHGPSAKALRVQNSQRAALKSQQLCERHIPRRRHNRIKQIPCGPLADSRNGTHTFHAERVLHRPDRGHSRCCTPGGRSIRKASRRRCCADLPIHHALGKRPTRVRASRRWGSCAEARRRSAKPNRFASARAGIGLRYSGHNRCKRLSASSAATNCVSRPL